MLITILGSNPAFEHCIYEKNSNYREKMMKTDFFSFRDFSLQNLTQLKGQLHREIEQVALYRMVCVTNSMNLDFSPNRLPIPSDKPFSRSY